MYVQAGIAVIGPKRVQLKEEGPITNIVEPSFREH